MERRKGDRTMGSTLQLVASISESFGLSGFLIAIVVGGLVIAAAVSAVTGRP
jgi:hypothetical protein